MAAKHQITILSKQSSFIKKKRKPHFSKHAGADWAAVRSIYQVKHLKNHWEGTLKASGASHSERWAASSSGRVGAIQQQALLLAPLWDSTGLKNAAALMYRFPNQEAARFLWKWLVFNKRACNGPKDDTTVASQKSTIERRKKKDSSHLKKKKNLLNLYLIKAQRNHIQVAKLSNLFCQSHSGAEEIPFSKMLFRIKSKSSFAVNWQLKQKLKWNELPFYILCCHQRLSIYLSVFYFSAEILLSSFL